MNLERFFMLTNPLYWLAYLLACIAKGAVWIWDKALWNRKRFYWHMYDYHYAKKEIQGGLTKQELVNVKAYLRREDKKKIKHRYLKELKSLVIEAEIILNGETNSEARHE